jgi:RNA polymerase sigma-70 factor (ECF subfamily)
LRAGRGDHDAFGEVVRRHELWARTFAARILRDPVGAEDMAQEAFIRLWTSAPRWEGSGSARGWLATTLSRLCIDQLRKQRPHELLQDDVHECPTPDARKRAEHRETHLRLAELISLLPVRQRLALTLFYDEEQSIREAATTMDLTPKAFESLLIRARRSLQQLWEASP